jgi:hypothetical protein
MKENMGINAANTAYFSIVILDGISSLLWDWITRHEWTLVGGKKAEAQATIVS